MNRKTFKATMLATVLCLGAFVAPALAQFNLSIDIGIPPPPPRYEAYEEPRPGYVMIPGFWIWNGREHQWHERRWERARPGQRYEPARWEDRGNSHHFEPGRWESEHKGKKNDDRGRGNQGRGHGRNDDDGQRDNPGRGHDRG